MRNILYIGNNLNNKTSNLSGIQTLGPLLETEGFVIHYASSKANKILRLFDMVWTCLKLFKKIDIVLIDTYSTQNFYYAFVVSQFCRLLNIEYIPILHGGNLTSRLSRSPKLSRLIFNNSKHNVSPSMYLKNAFEDVGFKNIMHIPNTIKIDNYPLSDRAYDEPRLLWVRSFSKIYNPELAVHVFNKLKVLYPSASLCMVGPDADGSRKTVEELAKKLNLNIKFTGKLEKKDWINLSRAYNVFINTTNYDNTPVSVIEAMALGLPVISTNVGGMPYLIEHEVDGILVEPNQPEEMSSAVVSIIRNSKKRNSLVQNAREKVNIFDWNQVKLLWFNALNIN
ncbi:glycosyltransferase family 4 protein [Psychroserpens ponticola]|uniref:Glycosyltransferase family 4 protein n=1 Tax=Psychroserpens ponticola TaxID=2932268 RepID=A0ABY7RZH7_9FLAO|nr:glycosyltransferase family 4 protein [Psychroserpens ponticola]WCO02549.1 glycosyltransferase family 4 protein [Psychroserpens ponticola]